MNPKEVAITIGIAVLFSALVLVTIEAIYQRPTYEQFCKDTLMYAKPIPAQDNCTYDYTNENVCYTKGENPKFDVNEKGCRYVTGCDPCNKDFDAAQKRYTNTVFYILAVIGAIAIIFGVYYKIEFLGTGFMFSGIFLLFYGTVQNFGELGRWTRPIVLLLELGLVMFIAYKKVVKK